VQEEASEDEELLHLMKIDHHQQRDSQTTDRRNQRSIFDESSSTLRVPRSENGFSKLD
jgi:hypothetical protein